MTESTEKEVTEHLKDVMFKQFKKKLSFSIENKNGDQSPEFFQDLHEWFMVAPEANHLNLIDD